MPFDNNKSDHTMKDFKSPLEMLYHWETNHPNDVYLRQPINGKVRNFTWAEVGQEVRQVAAGIKSLALDPGSRICIFSKNCAHWFITDLAIMMAGHVSVPIFATAGGDTINYVLKHADVKLMFVGKLDNIESAVAPIPDDMPTVAFPYEGIPGNSTWAEFTDIAPLSDNPNRDKDELMTIIYTSGSTGQPKGVMHSFATINWAAHSCLNQLDCDKSDRVMSYLPLAHITERVIVELASFYSGMQITFVESLDTFNHDVVNAQPTLFVSVPRLWTKFQMGVLAKMPQKKLSLLLSVPIIKGIVAKKIRTGLGLDSTRLFASGSAPLAPAVIRWFEKLGITISEGWGMTENSAYGTSAVPFRSDKVGTIGKAYDGVDIRISEAGEIQVKAPCVMLGYYLEPEKTSETMTDDGYLRTGDKGEIDSEGFVKITGRLKEIFKTSKGKYVVPAPIEAKIVENTNVEQVCVTGCDLPQPVALMVLSAEANHLSRDELSASLSNTLQQVNATLESHMRLDNFIVLKDEWTIDNALLTPTLKVKRHVLEERFADIIQSKYDQKVTFID
jgi:long-subunit acyl-CoA synthetase (AMP-forming)